VFSFSFQFQHSVTTDVGIQQCLGTSELNVPSTVAQGENNLIPGIAIAQHNEIVTEIICNVKKVNQDDKPKETDGESNASTQTCNIKTSQTDCDTSLCGSPAASETLTEIYSTPCDKEGSEVDWDNDNSIIIETAKEGNEDNPLKEMELCDLQLEEGMTFSNWNEFTSHLEKWKFNNFTHTYKYDSRIV
jgi:hypothetical protein